MAKADKLLDDLTLALVESLDDFNASLPAIEKQMYERVLELVSELERSNGRIKVSAKNIRLIGQIRKELNKVILTPKYKKQVEKFAASFDAIEQLQTAYFDALADGYSAPAVMKALRDETVNAVIESLTETGINYNVSQKISDILRQNITTGGKFSDLVESLREQMVADGEGALTRYAKTYTTDALYTYSRQYDQIFSEDLGIEWYRWVGPLKDTSREFCKAMEENTGPGGCLQYIHISQFPELIAGNVCGDKVAINSKTGLPNGFKKGTTAANFATVAAGWSCGHKLIPVPTAAVPESFRKKFS